MCLLVQSPVLSHHRSRVPHGLDQVGQSRAVLACVSAAQRTRSGHLDRLTSLGGRGGLLESGEQRLHRFGGKVLVVVVVDLDHGSVDAGTQAFDLDEGEEAVFGSVSRGDTQVFRDRLDDLVATATTELAGCLKLLVSDDKDEERYGTRGRGSPISYRCAKLNKVLANRLTVVHGVEGCDFVDTHGGHLQETGDLVHDADAGVAVLALTNVQDRHDSGLLVLGGIALEDLIDELEVLLGELERNIRVVIAFVAVLDKVNWLAMTPSQKIWLFDAQLASEIISDMPPNPSQP